MTRLANKFADRMLNGKPRVKPRVQIDHSREPLQKELEAAGAVFKGKSAAVSLHPDAKPSAGIYERKGIWRYKCQVCGAGGDLEDIRKLLGEKPTFASNGDGHKPSKIVKVYSYVDETGEPLFEKVRYEPKSFSLRRPNRTPGLGNARRVLYRLPKLIAATPETVIFLPEGEKDADNICAADLVATTNFEGASKPGQRQKWEASYNEFFRGRIVGIIADKDDAGRARADFIARQLSGVAAEARVIEVPGAACKDASDFLSAGGDAEQLLALFDAAPIYKPLPVEAVATEAGAADGEGAEPILVCMADVKREPIRWLWRGRMARGKVTMIAGDPGLGKSLLTMDLAARLSSGTPWPDTPGEANPAGSIIILNCEDDLSDTVAPRLHRAGANMDKIIAMQGVRYGESGRERSFDLQRDLPMLEAAAAKMPDLAAVVIDPITAYLGSTDSYKNAEVRALLAPLADFAAKRGAAIICVSHLNKGSGPAIYRTMGSLAFVAAARTAWAVTLDKDDPTGERRLMLPIKNNLWKNDGGVAFRVVGEAGDVCAVSWEEGTVSTTADLALALDAPAEDAGTTQTDRAADWLRQLLAAGPVAARDVLKSAKDCGISERTLNRAKSELKVHTFRREVPGPWFWELPSNVANNIANPSLSKPLGNLGNLGIFIDDSLCPRGNIAKGTGMVGEYAGEPGEGGNT